MDRLRAINPHLSVFHVGEARFARYGRVLEHYDFDPWVRYLSEHTAVPPEGNVYVPSEAALEALAPFSQVRDTLYGGLPIQAGYCNGNSSRLNGLEYHKAAEVIVAATDLALQLADYGCMRDFTLHVDHVEVFLVPAGTAIELKPTALHLAPSRTSDAGFKAVIVLPAGVNTDLPADCALAHNDPESRLLFRKGKWLLAHPENGVALAKGAHAALIGPNLQFNHR